MTNDQLKEIDEACGEGCGVVCAFFVKIIEEKKPTPLFIKKKPYLILGLGNFTIYTKLYGEQLQTAIQSLIFKGVLETRVAASEKGDPLYDVYIAGYHFDVDRLKEVLTDFKEMQERIKELRRLGVGIYKSSL